MNKEKDQKAAPTPATDDEKQKKISLSKSRNKQVIINPPEKVDRSNGSTYDEAFVRSLNKHTVSIAEKVRIILQSKGARAGLEDGVLEQVYIRGYKNLPLNTTLTREQYAINRVNSFIAGGAALLEDCDLFPIAERVGLRGSGGGMRPHIKREVNPYNRSQSFRVVDKNGHVKFTTSNEIEARKHLAMKYRAYMENVEPVAEVSGELAQRYFDKSIKDKPKTMEKALKRFQGQNKAQDRINTDELKKIKSRLSM